ncbi:YncE family protein [Nonomuraea sp. NPDC050556]|uniref:YncE family protein n=1 Tax=Nonomuraea sp. NPDC050556 TaxID=3364369 RepID=UPI0037A6B63A
MTTRRELLAGALALAALSACGESEPSKGKSPAMGERPPAMGERPLGLGGRPLDAGVLFARTAAGLAAVDLATAQVRATYTGAIPDQGWTSLHELTPQGELRLLDAATGTVRTTIKVGGQQVDGLQIKAVSDHLVAVGPEPGPRTSTPISLVSDAGVRELRLAGNVEPEAFSTDEQVMYVLEYLPPDKPDRYRVRMYDLAQGVSNPLLTRDKRPVPQGKEEEMRGQGRQAVRGDGVLYTLYNHQPDHLHVRDLVAGHDSAPEVHAFVHVLNLEQRWAYCLDLPQPFGLGPAEGHTLALSGGRLYVFDATSGRLVTAGTEQLTLDRSAFLTPSPGPAAALVDGNRLYLASGTQVQVVGTANLTSEASWSLPGQARGLAMRSGELLVGSAEQVLRLDPATGARRGVIDLPGLQAVLHAQ